MPKGPRTSENSFEDGVLTMDFGDGYAAKIDVRNIPSDMFSRFASRGLVYTARMLLHGVDDNAEKAHVVRGFFGAVEDGTWSPRPGRVAGEPTIKYALEREAANLAVSALKPGAAFNFDAYLTAKCTPDKSGRMRGQAKAVEVLMARKEIAPYYRKLLAARGKNLAQGDDLDITAFAA